MMRLTIGIAIALGIACTTSGADNDATLAVRDSAAAPAADTKPAAVSAEASIDSTAKRAIAALSTRDMATLSALVHPTFGLRFSPYQYVDKQADRVFTKEQVEALGESREVFLWGTHDGSGEPLRLTYPDYHDAFVYDADFRRAPRIATDAEPMGSGTTANTIRDVYPEAHVVEYHIPGRDPAMGGLDWKSLWLVFQQHDANWYLVGVVHGAWTT